MFDWNGDRVVSPDEIALTLALLEEEAQQDGEEDAAD